MTDGEIASPHVVSVTDGEIASPHVVYVTDGEIASPNVVYVTDGEIAIPYVVYMTPLAQCGNQWLARVHVVMLSGACPRHWATCMTPCLAVDTPFPLDTSGGP